MVRAPKGVLWLAGAIAVVSVAVAAVGLLWDAGAASTTYVSVRGETVEVFGRGISEHDSTFTGAGYRNTDTVALFLAVPFLMGR
jgi:hypothetical protein